MNIFVTGGSGFLGGHLLRALVNAGHTTRALARSDATTWAVEECGAVAIHGDLADHHALREGMTGCDAVVHAAALTDQWGPRRRFDQVNVDGTSAVLDAASRQGVPRLVHISTEAVLATGRPLVQVNESYSRSRHPVGEYARTKAMAEKITLEANSPKLTTVAVRPRFVWGPGDTTVLPAIIEAVEKNRFAWVDGGRYSTSTCHVTNACEGILCALEHGHGGQAYFITDGEKVEFRTFLTELAATTGIELPDRSVPRWLLAAVSAMGEAIWRPLRLPGTPPVTRTFLALSGQEMTVDDGLARRDLGYHPVLTRDEGLRQLTAYRE